MFGTHGAAQQESAAYELFGLDVVVSEDRQCTVLEVQQTPRQLDSEASMRLSMLELALGLSPTYDCWCRIPSGSESGHQEQQEPEQQITEPEPSGPVLLGVHACEATEAIVDAALATGLPFAVVPCCAPPANAELGRAAETYADFVDRLVAKGEGEFRRADLTTRAAGDFGAFASVIFRT